MKREASSTRSAPRRARARRSDEDILAEARGRLLGESLLGCCEIVPDGQGSVPPRAAALFPEGSSGVIQIHVADGVIYLTGEVSTLTDRRLAAEVVGRVPGCRRVVNQLTPSTGVFVSPCTLEGRNS
jgi:hypothetical protein